jgi:hypothetical protein
MLNAIYQIPTLSLYHYLFLRVKHQLVYNIKYWLKYNKISRKAGCLIFYMTIHIEAHPARECVPPGGPA